MNIGLSSPQTQGEARSVMGEKLLLAVAATFSLHLFVGMGTPSQPQTELPVVLKERPTLYVTDSHEDRLLEPKACELPALNRVLSSCPSS